MRAEVHVPDAPSQPTPSVAVALPVVPGPDDHGARALRGSLLRIAGYGVSAALGVVGAAVTFRALGVDEAGQYVTVVAVFALAAALTDAGLANVAVRDLATIDPLKRFDYMRTMMGLRLVTGLVGAAGALGFMAVAGYDELMLVAAAFAAVGVVLQVAQQTAIAPLVADLRIKPVVLLEVLRQLVQVALIIVAFLVGAGVVGFIATGIPAGALALVATYIIARSVVPIGFSVDWRRWWAILRPALPLAVASAVMAAYFRAAMVATSLVSSDFEIGLFGATFRITEVIIGVPILTAGTVLPFLVRSAHVGLHRFRIDLGTAVQTAIIAGVAVALVVFVGAPTIINIVAGAAFGDAVPVLRIQSLSLVFVFVTAALGVGMMSVHANRWLLIAGAIGLVVNLATVIPLAYTFGARGAALATVLAEMTLCAAMYVGLRIVGAAPTVSLGRAGGAVLIAGILAAVALLTEIPNLVLLLAAPSVFVACVWFSGIVPMPVRREIRRMASRGERV